MWGGGGREGDGETEKETERQRRRQRGDREIDGQTQTEIKLVDFNIQSTAPCRPKTDRQTGTERRQSSLH